MFPYPIAFQTMNAARLASIELCAGAGGQALGLEAAGFEHELLIEIESAACQTLKQNRPSWNVREADVRTLSGARYRGIDLLAAGVPCPPFSIAGKQRGPDDERDLFPTALRLVDEIRPAAVILENVPGFASERFQHYRRGIVRRLTSMGYGVDWRILNACDYGVPQLRPRFVLVAIKQRNFSDFAWPSAVGPPPSVGDALYDLMSADGWSGAKVWSRRAKGIAPTLVGGSRLHGGPDLGPTRARAAWRSLGVDGRGVADSPPNAATPADAVPRLTVRMAARVQGFPDSWVFSGRKTAAYRQVGNAFPPPIARAVAERVRAALLGVRNSAEPEQYVLPYGPS